METSKAEQIAKWVIDNRQKSIFNQVSDNEMYNEVFFQVRNIEKQRDDLLEALIEGELQLRRLYNDSEFEGHFPVRSALDKMNSAINKATK